MLKIKDCLVNEDEVRYIQPFYNGAHGYCILITFKNDSSEYIFFASKEERDKEINRLSEKVEKE